MIVNTSEMKYLENESGDSEYILMERVGNALYTKMNSYIQQNSKICILVGVGNNGGDALVLARLFQKEHDVKVILVCGKPKTLSASKNLELLPKHLIVSKKNWISTIEESDVIIDGVFGFSYHGELHTDTSKLFQQINQLNKTVYAIDINSGCEADTGICCKNALRSAVTFPIEYAKPFHLLQKEHHMFQKYECVSIGLPKLEKPTYLEMNEESFFAHFPKKQDNAYKNTYGKTLFVSGSYGMAGAASLNIIGAKTMGASYIDVVLPESIYPIVASQHITPVFHPTNDRNQLEILLPLIQNAKAIGFGSGCTNLNRANDILDCILQNATCPIVLDAFALRLLKQNTWIFRFTKAPVILTPHIGEFSYITNQPIPYIHEHLIPCAKQFAQKNKIVLVLKGANTVVAFPNGECYINQSGNQALAQAGSGDLLTGILTSILTMTRDITHAVCMAVWIHGHLADIGLNNYAMQTFSLDSYPTLMNSLFKKHNF